MEGYNDRNHASEQSIMQGDEDEVNDGITRRMGGLALQQQQHEEPSPHGAPSVAFADPPQRNETLSQTQQQSVDRRSMFERHWSTSKLTSCKQSGSLIVRPSNPGRQQSTPTDPTSSTATASYVDIASLQASWANTSGNDIFGSALQSTTEFPPSPNNFGPRDSLMSSMSSVTRNDSSSSIHDAARITDWDRVLDLCASHPEYAKFSGVDGWTALHHACNRRCPRPEVAEALIEAYPDALVAEEEKGWLPLHYACRFKAPKSVVELLLHMRPEVGRGAVSRKDRLGRTPLYYAVRYDAPPGVVGLLLEVDPGAVLEEDQNEESPLALVWNTWADKLEGKRVIRTFLPGGFPEPEGVTEQERTKLLWDQLRKQPKILKKWEKVNMLLKAAFGFPVEDDDIDAKPSASIGSERTWRILHAAAATKCHLSLFLMACALHPEQAQELDESDLRRPSDPMLSGVSTHQTALHLAASSNAGGEAGKTVIQDLLDLCRYAVHVQDAIDGSLPLHKIVENKYKQDWPNFGSLLCHVYPKALQIPDHNGKLPLHRATAAISHAKTNNDEDYTRRSVIMNVVRLYPQGASHLDNSGCLPFHILAMNAELWDENVESVYNSHQAAVQARAGTAMENRLPIHLAAGSPRSRDPLIARLLRLHPRGVSVPDRQGKLAFHLGCEVGKEWGDGLGTIHDAFPAAATQTEGNARNWFPLHMAANCPESSAALISKLVELHPAAASVPDSDGCYPFHLACSAGKMWNTGLETLFNASPASLATVNKAGLLPLHVAALRCCKTVGKDTAVKEDEEVSLRELENLYQLLRADPSVI